MVNYFPIGFISFQYLVQYLPRINQKNQALGHTTRCFRPAAGSWCFVATRRIDPAGWAAPAAAKLTVTTGRTQRKRVEIHHFFEFAVFFLFFGVTRCLLQ